MKFSEAVSTYGTPFNESHPVIATKQQYLDFITVWQELIYFWTMQGQYWLCA